MGMSGPLCADGMRPILTRASIGKSNLNGFLHRPESIEVCYTHVPETESAVNSKSKSKKRSHFGMRGHFAARTSKGVTVGLIKTTFYQPCS